MDDSNRDDDGTDDADWKNTLIRVYLFVCKRWSGGLCAVAQRQSNNSSPDFTDEEVLTIYLFGLIRKRETIKEIPEYAEDHFLEWFPDLPSYGGYVQRLNRLSAAFAPLTEAAIAEIGSDELIETLRIADSFPHVWRRKNGPRKRRWPRRLPTRDIAPQRTPPITDAKYMWWPRSDRGRCLCQTALV